MCLPNRTCSNAKSIKASRSMSIKYLALNLEISCMHIFWCCGDHEVCIPRLLTHMIVLWQFSDSEAECVVYKYMQCESPRHLDWWQWMWNVLKHTHTNTTFTQPLSTIWKSLLNIENTHTPSKPRPWEKTFTQNIISPLILPESDPGIQSFLPFSHYLLPLTGRLDFQ